MVKSVTTWHLKCHGHSPSRFESAWRQRIETKQQAPKTKSSAAFFASRQSRGGLTWQPQNLTTHLTGAKPRLGDMLGQFRGGEAPRSIQKTLSWSKTSQPPHDEATSIYFNFKEKEINLEGALLILVLYHDRYLFRNQQLLHVHDLRAINVKRRRRNLKRNEMLLTSFVGLRSLQR